MKIIDIKDFQKQKVEYKYFEFYLHTEEFFENRTTEIDIIERLCFATRYISDLSHTIKKHIDDGKATNSFKGIVRVEDSLLKKISEVLDV